MNEAPQPHVQHITINQQNPNLERSWAVALTLSILLGWLGIDRFYLGSAGVGILKFFTFGLFGVLWLVDILMIATKSVRHVTWR